MTLEFKRADTDDIPALLDMVAAYYAYDGHSFDAATAQRGLEALLANESYGRVWLMRHEGETVGYIILTFGFSLEVGGRDSFIDEIFIREDFTGRGFGKQAIAFLEQYARDNGIQALHLHVQRSNARAYAVYKKLNFHEWDRIPMTKEV